MTITGFIVGACVCAIVGYVVGAWVTENDPKSILPLITGGGLVIAWALVVLAFVALRK